MTCIRKKERENDGVRERRVVIQSSRGKEHGKEECLGNEGLNPLSQQKMKYVSVEIDFRCGLSFPIVGFAQIPLSGG